MRLLALVLLCGAAVFAKKTFDPEVDMDVPQMIRYWGYPVEIVTATTKDGYILDMHRIPSGKTSVPSPKPVVFLQHGLLGESSNWILNLPSESAAFVFADAGFDVWMGNSRGNTYALNNTTPGMTDEQFWKFSFDEMAQYDLDAQISKVLEITGQDSVYYVGHSQGTLIMFAHLSEDNGGAFTKKVKRFFALAPIGQVKNIKGSLKKMSDLFGDDFEAYFKLIGPHEFEADTWLSRWAAEHVCDENVAEENFCDNIFFAGTGPESNQWNKTRMDVYVSHVPGGTSTTNMVHWIQLVQSGGCAKYDYGEKRNKKIYGQATPPQYDFTKIKDVPIHLYWSDTDWLGDETDVTTWLIPKLQAANVLAANNKLVDFNHADFVVGLRATDSIYFPIIDIIKKDLGIKV